MQVKVAWVHAETRNILTIHEHVITRSTRHSVVHDNSSWTLEIRDVKTTDNGAYMCQVNNKLRMEDKSFIIYR